MKNKRRFKSFYIILLIVIVTLSFTLTFYSNKTNSIFNDIIYKINNSFKNIKNNFEGDGSIDSPYIIDNMESIKQLSNLVNSGNRFENNHFKLVNDIDLNNETWIPIGYKKEKPFSGIFDGNYHEISNYRIDNTIIEKYNNEEVYVGFFGYCENATIQNLGIENYTINYEYDYDTTMGGFAGSLTNSIISNCFSNGNLLTNDEKINPLIRNDVQEIIITNTAELNIEYTSNNTNGQGIILDLTKLSSNNNIINVNKNITFSGDISALKVIGNPKYVYDGVNIIINNHNNLSFYIEFVDMNIIGSSTNGTIYSSSNRNFKIVFNGNNSIKGYKSSPAINLKNSKLYIEAISNSSINIKGGDGANGNNGGDGYLTNNACYLPGYGSAGTNGGVGLISSELFINNCSNSNISIYGGNGGNGGNGGAGYDYTDAHKPARSTSGHGNDGYNGCAGNDGNNGGNGGNAVNASLIIGNNISLIGGIGGNAGNGGDGGDGAPGQDGRQQTGIFGWPEYGWNGGNGGKGGKGGNSGLPGSGGLATSSECKTIKGIINMTNGESGNLGTAGAGGKGGSGGDRGYRSGKVLGIKTSTSYGSYGNPGDPGSPGSVKGSKVSSSSKVINETIPNSYNLNLNNFSYNKLVCGGFVGFIDNNSNINNSVVKINDIKYNNSKNIIRGNFVGKYITPDSFKNIFAVNETLNNYDYNKYFGEQPIVLDSNKIKTLSTYINELDVKQLIDDNFILYDNDYNNSNSLIKERTIIGKVGSYSNITIPNYVYSGKFITEVTSIKEDAFLNNNNIGNVYFSDSIKYIGSNAFKNSSIKSLFIGENVEKIGDTILKNCNEIESIYIGQSLIEIPEMDNDEYSIFGLDKSNSNLKMYDVHKDNKKFMAIDGILYEKFQIGDKSITIAIIDVPTNVSLQKFVPSSNHVVKIYPFAFSYNKNITYVNLDYIREIGTSAFDSALKLQEVKFGMPENLDSEYIEILNQKISIDKIQYSQQIGINAFMNCKNLQKVNLESEFITKIGLGAFANCATNLDVEPLKITIGKNVTHISANFDDLYGELSNDSQDKTDSTNDSPLTNFMNTFKDAKIESFSVDKDNKSFYAENGILYLKTGKIVDEKNEIWLIIYPKNKTEQELKLSDNSEYKITTICKNAFFSAESLSKLYIHDSISKICNNAFENSKIQYINIGNSVCEIGTTPQGTSKVFSGCSYLTTIDVNEDNKYYTSEKGVLFNKAKSTLIKYPQAKNGYEYLVPSTVSELYIDSFSGNNIIRRVIIESEIKYLGNNAFSNCANLDLIYFKVGKPPFTTKEDVWKCGAFETDKSKGTKICYTENPDLWTLVSGTYHDGCGYECVKGDNHCNNDNILYKISEFSGYPNEKENLNKGYYAIVVTDNYGAPIDEVYVTLGNETVATTDGIATFKDVQYNFEYNFRVVDLKGNYFPYENDVFYLDEATKISYVKLSMVPTVSGTNVNFKIDVEEKIKEKFSEENLFNLKYMQIIGGSNQTYDINSEIAIVNKFLTDEFTLTFNCGFDMNSTITKYRIIQKNEEILSYKFDINSNNITIKEILAKKIAEIKVKIELDKIKCGEDLYVVVEFIDPNSEINVINSKLNIRIINLDFDVPDLDILFKLHELKISFHRDTPLLGGAELKLESKDKITKFVSVGIGPNYIRILFNNHDDPMMFNKKNIGDNFDWTQSEDSSGNNIFNDISDLDSYDSYVNMKNNYKGKIKSLDKSTDVGFTLSGYIEIRDNGKYTDDKSTYDVISSISGKVIFNANGGITVQVWVIPVRIEYEIKVTGELEFSLVFDTELKKFVEPNLLFELKGEIEGRVGIGCKLVSGGIYGRLEIVIIIGFVPELEVDKITLSGSFGAYFKVDAAFVKLNLKVAIYEFADETPIYENGKWFFENSKSNSSEISKLSLNDLIYDESSYEIPTSTLNRKFINKTIIDENNHSDYDGIVPQSVKVNNKIYIFYHEDLNNYSNLYDRYNYQKIIYKVYDIETNTYSDFKILDDNGYTDSSFKVISNKNNIFIIYSQNKIKITTDNIEDMKSYISNSEVKVANITNDNITINTLTNNSYNEMCLRIGYINNILTAIWVRNVENNLFGITTNNNLSICYRQYINNTWTNEKTLVNNINTISDLEITGDGVCYITDFNNDFNTIDNEHLIEGYSDKSICYVDMNGNIIYQTEEMNSYLDISVIDNEIVYYLNNTLYNLLTNEIILNNKLYSFNNDYTIVNDEHGNAIILLYIVNNLDDSGSSNGSNLYASFKENGLWSSAVNITKYDFGLYVTAFDAVFVNNNLHLSILNTIVKEISIENETFETQHYFDNYLITFEKEYEIGDLELNYEDIIPNEVSTILIEIINTGQLTIKNVPLSIKHPNGEVLNFNINEVYTIDGDILTNGLMPGGIGYLKVSFNVGEVNDDEYQFIFEEQQNENLNCTLWQSDFSVYGKIVEIGNDKNIIAKITNLGYLAKSYDYDIIIDNVIVFNGNTEELSNYETQYISYKPGIISEGTSIKIKINADDEYLTKNNECQISYMNKHDDLELDLEQLEVWISEKNILIDKKSYSNIIIEFNNTFNLLNIKINDDIYLTGNNDLYIIENDKIIINTEKYIEKYDLSNNKLIFEFSDDTSISKFASAQLNVSETFNVKFYCENELIQSSNYYIGETPSVVKPFKVSDEKYDYEFIGWDNNNDGLVDEVESVNNDAIYYAVFNSKIRSYHIEWIVDGKTIRIDDIEYGQKPTYDLIPEKDSTAQFYFEFIGWDKEIEEVTKDEKYIAIFKEIIRKYKVTIIVDGTEEILYIEYGNKPLLNDPIKEMDEKYTYTFERWSHEICPVYADQIYEAIFSSNLRIYEVTWIIDNTIITEKYEYGSIPTYNKDITKNSTAEFSYEFIGWDKEFEIVTNNVVYTARFDSIINTYTVTWIIDDQIYNQIYNYGDMPTCNYTIMKPSDETYKYIFNKWDKAIEIVTNNVTYTAIFDKEYIGKATITNSKFTTSWSCNFDTTISLNNIEHINTTVITIIYDSNLIKINSILPYDNIRILEHKNNYISLEINNYKALSDLNLIFINATTTEHAPIGENNLFDVYSDCIIYRNFNTLDIFEMGDVNMDGIVNIDDVSLVQQYSVNKINLNQAQLKYANVNYDFDECNNHIINIIDVAMIYRRALNKLSNLGNRILLTFVYNGEVYKNSSIICGSDIDMNILIPEGFVVSYSNTELIEVDFTNLNKDTTIYLLENLFSFN